MYKDIYKIGNQISKANYLWKLNASKDYVNKILPRLLKERAKRKSAEDQTNDSLFSRDTLLDPKPVVSDPGLPKNTESVHPVSIETSSNSKESLPLDNVSLPAEGLSKEKPSSLKANGNGNGEKANSNGEKYNSNGEKANGNGNGEKANGEKSNGEKANGEIIRKARKESVSIAFIPQSSMQSNLQPDTASSLSTHPASKTVLNLLKSLEFSKLKVGLLRGLLPLPVILSLGTIGGLSSNVFVKEYVRLDDRPMIILTLIAALVVSYALNSRENRTLIAKVFLQVMVIFLSILYLLDIFGRLAPMLEINPAVGSDDINPAVGSDEINPAVGSDDINPAVGSDEINPAVGSDEINPAAASDGDGPLTQPNAWYSSKKVWGCSIVVGLAVAAVIYYLKGSAPDSPDDMASFTTAVSQGIDRVSSSQVSLGQTVAERVNSAAFRAELQNRTLEEILSDIAAAGDVARLQLEQMTGVTQDFIQQHSNINDRMTVLLKGIFYLVSLRWVFSRLRHNSAPGSAPAEDLAPAVGSDVVNEVMSLERPFSFDSAISIQNLTTEAVMDVAQTDEAAVVDVAQTEAAATVEISTQTNDLFMDRAYTVLRPAIDSIGETRLLARLRRIIGGSLSSSDDDEDGVGYVSAETSTQELATGTSTTLPTTLPTGTSTTLPTGILTYYE